MTCFSTPLDQAQIDFENEGGETYICGNPPYLGSKWQTDEQKADLQAVFEGRTTKLEVARLRRRLVYEGRRLRHEQPVRVAAFVCTNSICQGPAGADPLAADLHRLGTRLRFAHTSFKWANLASHNAGVTVVIVGHFKSSQASCDRLVVSSDDGARHEEVGNINAVPVPGPEYCRQPAR